MIVKALYDKETPCFLNTDYVVDIFPSDDGVTMYTFDNERRGYFVKNAEFNRFLKAEIDLDVCGEWLEQEPCDDVLDKIKAEVIARDRNVKTVRSDGRCLFTAEEVLEIIDKYRKEREENND